MQENQEPARRRLSDQDRGPQDEDDWADAGAARRIARRDAGVRQTRQLSTWTAALLIAGVAAGAGYFVHAAATPAVTAGSAATQGTVSGTGQKPSLTHPVVTSGGSGVSVGTAGGSPGSGGGAVTWRDS